MANLKKAVGARDGVSGGEEFRTKVVERFVRESQMLEGKDFGTAADKARKADEQETHASGPSDPAAFGRRRAGGWNVFFAAMVAEIKAGRWK